MLIVDGLSLNIWITRDRLIDLLALKASGSKFLAMPIKRSRERDYDRFFAVISPAFSILTEVFDDSDPNGLTEASATLMSSLSLRVMANLLRGDKDCIILTDNKIYTPIIMACKASGGQCKLYSDNWDLSRLTLEGLANPNDLPMRIRR